MSSHATDLSVYAKSSSLNVSCNRVTAFDIHILHTHFVPKKLSPLILQYIWFLLIWTILYRYCHKCGTHSWSNICHLAWIALPHYWVKCEQLRSCENHSVEFMCSTCTLVMRKISQDCVFGFFCVLILLPIVIPFDEVTSSWHIYSDLLKLSRTVHLRFALMKLLNCCIEKTNIILLDLCPPNSQVLNRTQLNIKYIQAVREGATICCRPCKLTFWSWKWCPSHVSRVTWATSVPILVFLGLSVLDLGLMYATDRRQTDIRPASSFNAPYRRGGA